MRWLNYQHLFYFWNVVRLGGVSQAARQLSLAQPTISAQLKSFEDVLGEKLLERSGRNLKVTEVGQVAYRYAEQIFSIGQEFLDLLDGKNDIAQKELKIGISDVVPKALAYRLIEPAFAGKQECSVLCFEDKTERLLADLAIGQIDLVLADRPIPPNVKVKAFNHFIGECGVAFLAHHEIARFLKKNFPRSLNAAPLLFPTHESALRRDLDQWFEKVGVTPKNIGSFQDRALMKIVAREKKGILPVPLVVESEVRREYHLELVGKTEQVKEQLYLISLERRLKNPLVAEICAQGQTRLFRR
jgi:LysR family transcriptional activator of nhaA